MPFQPVAATALAELVMTLDGQVIENTLYFRQANDYTAADLATLASDLVTWWSGNMAPLLSSTCSLIQVVTTALHSQTGPQFTQSLAPPPTGASGTDSVPNNSAFCLTFRTALIGRSFRGRNFISGIPENNVVLSRITSAAASSLVAAYDRLRTPGVGGSRVWVVVSRVVNGVVQSPSALTNPVTSVVARDFVMDSQRRRLPGRGR